MKHYLIFFGPPGSGKGTQAVKVAEKLKLPLISTGDLLRQELARASQLGKIARKFMEKGKLVPDELLEQLVSRRLTKPDAKGGAIFDGFPRSTDQQEFLLSKLRNTLKAGAVSAVLIDVGDKQVKGRLSGRRACICGAVYHLKFNPPKRAGVCDRDGKKLFIRNDDKPKVIADRLKVYHRQSRPLIEFWQKSGRLLKINGEQSIDSVWRELKRELKKIGV